MPAGIGENPTPLFSLPFWKGREKRAAAGREERGKAWRLQNAAILSPEVVTFWLSSII